MNNIFEWKRFSKVVKKDFNNLWSTFGITMIILAAIPFAIWLLALVIDHSLTISPGFRVVMLMTVAEFAAIMLPSRLYRTMNLRNEGISFAMLPASKLEKFISLLFFTFIVAPVFVYIGSLVMDIILSMLPASPYRQWIWQSNLGFPVINVVVDSTNITSINNLHNGWITAAIWTSFLGSPSIFLFAATLFKKHKVLYTLLCIYLIEFVSCIILIPILVALSQNVKFIDWVFFLFDKWSLEEILNWGIGICFAFNCIVTILFTWLAWHRLKKMPY